MDNKGTPTNDHSDGVVVVFLNGGQRGLQIQLEPNDARKALDAIARPVSGHACVTEPDAAPSATILSL